MLWFKPCCNNFKNVHRGFPREFIGNILNYWNVWPGSRTKISLLLFSRARYHLSRRCSFTIQLLLFYSKCIRRRRDYFCGIARRTWTQWSAWPWSRTPGLLYNVHCVLYCISSMSRYPVNPSLLLYDTVSVVTQ